MTVERNRKCKVWHQRPWLPAWFHLGSLSQNTEPRLVFASHDFCEGWHQVVKVLWKSSNSCWPLSWRGTFLGNRNTFRTKQGFLGVGGIRGWWGLQGFIPYPFHRCLPVEADFLAVRPYPMGNQPWGLEAGELFEDLVMLREGVVSHSGSGNGCSLPAERRLIPPPQTEHGLNLNELKLSFPSLSGSNKHPKGLQSQRARNHYSFHFTHFHLLPEVLVL